MTRFAIRTFLAVVVAAASAAGPLAAAGDVRMIEAVKLGDADAVRALIRQRVDVNAPEADGTRALHWAVQADHRDLAGVLVKAGADVNVANRYGVTPLAMAVVNGSEAMTDLLLKAGADPGVALPEGETVLMTAAKTGTPAVISLLLAHGVDVNAKEGWFGQTALMWAVAENHAAATQALLDAGADVHARSNLIQTPRRQPLSTTPKGGFTPLLFAAREGAIDSVRPLLAAGARLSDVDPDGIGPLTMAIINGHYDLASLLLEQGADVSLTETVSGRTALIAAVDMHTLEWAPNRPAPKPRDTLDSLDIIRRLLARGADPNVRLKGQVAGRKTDLTPDAYQVEGGTAFIRAAKSSDVVVLRLLLEKGADPNAVIADGTTPLMAAAGVNWRDVTSNGSESDAIEVIKLCLERGADVNAANDAGYTPLHGAARRGSDAILRFLVERGAKLDVKTKAGRSVLDEAYGDQNGAGDADRYPPRLSTIALIRQLLGDR